MPPPQIPGPIDDYCRDWSGRANQQLKGKRQTRSRSIVCCQWYAHGHYSPNCRLPYGRRKEIIANFKSLMLTEQEKLFWRSMQIAVVASQAAENQADLTVQQMAAANQ